MPATVLEEEPGVLKSGVVTAGWTPVKTKKQFYAVLVERALELYESEKTYRKKKPPKHTIDLSVAFNVHTDHSDPKMKRCMCLSGPDDALLIKGDNDNGTNDWYSAILDALIPARATRLGRPVQPLEFFEYVWDVEIVQQPKLKRAPKIDENLPNMCEKTPFLVGPKRLCFYAHTIILCRRRIEPATTNLPNSCVPPFSVDDFVELSRKYIATFGCCEKYFLIRMGRGSTMGACELWAQCENEEVAADIHDKLNRIIEREAEKKKKLGNGEHPQSGNGPVMPSLPHHHHSRIRTDPSYRDRINTEPANSINECPAVTTVYSSASVSAPSSGRSGRTRLDLFKARMDSFESDNRLPIGVRRDSRPSIGSLHATSLQSELTRRVGSPSFSGHGSAGPSRKPSTSGTPSMGFESPFAIKGGTGPSGRMNSVSSVYHYSSGKGGQPSSRRASDLPETASRKNTPRETVRTVGLEALSRLQPNVSQSTQEETEDSGGTLRLESGSTREPDSVSMNSRRSIAVEATIERRPPSTSEDTDLEATSSCSSAAGIPPPEDYAPMDAADWTVDGTYLIPNHGLSKDKQFHLDEVRSYVSDSSDSCYSSLANNNGATLNKPGQQPPRAYSFGARTVPQAVAATFNNGTSVTMDSGASLESASKEALAKSGLLAPSDPESQRLRAFSLGSKHLFTRPFRKLSQHANRSTRHSQTTASGVSLASSSNASSSGQPTTSSSTHQISALTNEAAAEGQRNRSGSFGSGRSTPFNKRGGSVGGPGSERGPSHDHLVEIDFGGMGRSGSGSVHSVDSPSRSRTSSFGGKTEFPHTTIGEPCEEGPIHEEVSPSTSLTQSTLKNSIFKDFHGDEYGDYVPTQINDPTVFVQAGAAEEVAAYCGQHHLVTAPQEVGRQSQHFETIQESNSPNNSRCSSRTSIHKIDEDYALMDGSERESRKSGGKSPLIGAATRARSRSAGRPTSQPNSSTPVVFEADEDYVGCKVGTTENGRHSDTSSEAALTIDTNIESTSSSTISPAIHRAFVGRPNVEHKRSQGNELATSPLALPSTSSMPKPSSMPHQLNEPNSALNYAMLQVSLEPRASQPAPTTQKPGVQQAQPRRSRSRSGTSPGRFGSGKASTATPTNPPEAIEYTILQRNP